MAAPNTSPIFGLTPRLGRVNISTASANVSSSGDGLIGTNIFAAFSAGPNGGSFVQKIRFNTEAQVAAVNSVATTLRIFTSTSDGQTGTTTTVNNTDLIGEISVPIISTANSTNATNFYEYPLNFAIPTGYWILVSQHVAQTAKQNWSATVIGSDY